MAKQGKFYTQLLTPEEEEQMYGKRLQAIGTTFKVNEHLYLQRKNDVLHLNTEHGVLNLLHVGFLNESFEKIEIDNIEFTNGVKKFIYENELDKFWGV
jgi:hypothetical protein